jgi:hypothetical protein
MAGKAARDNLIGGCKGRLNIGGPGRRDHCSRHWWEDACPRAVTAMNDPRTEGGVGVKAARGDAATSDVLRGTEGAIGIKTVAADASVLACGRMTFCETQH